MSAADSTINEIWVPVPRYDGTYEVSSLGRIRRVGGGHGSKHGRIIAQTMLPNGYLVVALHKKNRNRTFLVHRLVVRAFIGKLRKPKEVNHKDGNKKNNCACNLEIVTRRANIDHALANGLIDNKGEKNSQARLTRDEVEKIRASYTRGGYRNGGKGYKALGKTFGISWGTVRSIIKRKTWKHLGATTSP